MAEPVHDGAPALSCKFAASFAAWQPSDALCLDRSAHLRCRCGATRHSCWTAKPSCALTDSSWSAVLTSQRSSAWQPEMCLGRLRCRSKCRLCPGRKQSSCCRCKTFSPSSVW